MMAWVDATKSLFVVPGSEQLTLLSRALLTGLGVIILWSRLSRHEVKTVVLGRLLDTFDLKGTKRIIVELTIFVPIGVVVALSFVEPATSAQCLSAGFGWTGLLAQPRVDTRNPAENRRPPP